jgi:hypothetical protein
MKWFKLFLLALVGCWLLQPARAQVQLQVKLPEKFYVELKSEFRRVFRSPKGEIKDRTESSQVLGITVLKTNADGSRVVEVKIESFKEVITDEAGKKKEIAHADQQGAVLQVTLDPNLDVTKVEGIEEVLKKSDPKGTAKKETRAYQLEYFENVLRYWLSQIFVPMADKPVKTGDKWQQKALRTLGPYGNLKLTRELTYQGVEASTGQELHKVTFTTKHAFSPIKHWDAFPFKVSRASVNKGEFAGTIYFDAKAGLLVRSDAKELRDLVMTLNYEALDREVRIKDEGTSSMRFHEKNPLP